MLLTYVTVPAATLIYLLIDIYPAVRSFMAIMRTFSFWLMWLIFSILNLIAWAALKLATGEKIKTMLNNDELTAVALVILSTLSTLTIMQSLTVKIADLKFIDLGQLLEGYRRTVLADISKCVLLETQRGELSLARQLNDKYGKLTQVLRDEYASVMLIGGRTAADIGAELQALEKEAKASNLTFENILVQRLVKADMERARQLLKANVPQ